MKKKIIFAMFVFAFAVFSVAWSYSGYGKKVSENTSGTADGRILVCRKYSEINKVLAIDSKKKAHKKEVAGWNYDSVTGILSVTEDLSDFNSPLFHIEGKPSEPTQFILWNCDLETGPVAVFLNRAVATENREYVIDESKTPTITLKVQPKDVSSIAIVWHTPEGLSSISEISQKEKDLYAELEGAWFTENTKKSIMAQTKYPVLDFSECIDGNPIAAYAHGDKPKIVIKKFTDAEKQKMIDELSVNTYKVRLKSNMKSISKEAGFKINLPQKCGDYKIVSTMIIESALKGEKSKTVEFSYDTGDFFSLESISIETKKATSENAMDEIDKAEYPISTETLDWETPVIKQVCWSIGSSQENGTLAASGSDDMYGGMENGLSYKPEILCIYTWTENGTTYKTRCLETESKKIEGFIIVKQLEK